MNPIKLLSQPDKRKHALLCGAVALIGAVIAVLGAYVSFAVAAWLAGAAVAFGYEALQEYRSEGEASNADAIAGLVGATPVAAVILVVELYLLRG